MQVGIEVTLTGRQDWVTRFDSIRSELQDDDLADALERRVRYVADLKEGARTLRLRVADAGFDSRR